MPSANITDSKCVLVVGATAGIGRALALAIHDLPSKPTVIVSGRRQERLDELSKRAQNIKGIRLDVTSDKATLKKFVSDTLEKYPELDTVILSSGIQHIFDFAKPDQVDLDVLENELLTNYTSVVRLITFFLPHFLARSERGLPSFIIPITSGLSIVPGPWVPNYSATKAALHSLSLSLDSQLKDTNVHVMEIIPPLVESELHDHQGTTPTLSKTWMPLGDFTKSVMEGLVHGDVQIPVGQAKVAWEKFEKDKLEMVARASAFFKSPEQ